MDLSGKEAWYISHMDTDDPGSPVERCQVVEREIGRPVGWIVIALLVAARIALLAATVATVKQQGFGDPDVFRFHELASAPGTPYRDFEVEYAPVETIVIRAIGGSDREDTGARLACLAFVADLAVAAALAKGWGSRACASYLLFGLPLLVFLYLRFDLISVALASWGFVLARGRRDGPAAVLLSLAILSRVWPAVLLPALLVDRRRRAFGLAVVATAVGVGVWVILSTWRAPIQVLSFRGATGWGVDSTIGTILYVATGGPVRLESGAQRIGSVPPWAPPSMAAALAVALLATWLWTLKRRGDTLGAPALSALGSLLLLSPVFSQPYAAWLLPFASVAEGEEGARAPALAAVGVIVASAVLFGFYENGRADLATPIMILRVLLVLTLALWTGLQASRHRSALGR